MAGDTPDLDWLANDLFYDLFTGVLVLDASRLRVPGGWTL